MGIFKKISTLSAKKSCKESDIPTKLLLGTNDLICKPIAKLCNKAKSLACFPETLKSADITPLPKNKDKDLKKNYRPVSVTANLSKILEKDMYEQIYNYINNFLSAYLFGYRTKHNSEQCILVMTEMWKIALDEHKIAGAILTDLSKAFDCISHELLLAKLHAYGFSKSALKFIQDYLTERTQRVKVNGIYSTKKKLKYGVPQGSILGPLLFNIFMNDIFYFLNESKLANYADDISTYLSKKGIFPFLQALKSETSTVLKWFKINEMKSNSEKCHLIVAENKNKLYTSSSHIYLEEEKELLSNEKSVKLLGITIDDKLTFEEHLNNILKKGNQKLHALMRVSKYMTKDKLKILMNTFIETQFNYCPLVWMFHSREINNKINKLQERALRVVHKDETISYEELLRKNNSYTIHERNLQKLALLMFKVKHKLCPSPVQELFTENIKGNWQLPKIRTVNFGLETLRYRGPLTWDLVPKDLQSITSLETFKKKIKNWKPEGCNCRLCKVYVQGVGFLN